MGDWRGPLFVVGCSRSGTTLLQQMLNAHPRIAIAPETHFMPYYAAKREPYGDLARDDAFSRLVEDFAAATDFPDLGLAPDEFRRAARRAPRTFAGVFGLIMEMFARAKGAAIMGEKTPAHVGYLRELKAAFPAARFIHVVRDPRAVVNSRRAETWGPGDVRENAAFWVEQVGLGARGARELGRDAVTIRYEDLVARPDETLRRLCADLDVEFVPAMLEYWKHNTRLVNTGREPWKANALRPIQPGCVDRWRGRLSARDVLEIEAIAWPLMRAYRYRPVTPPHLLLPRVAARAAKDAFRRLRRTARARLRG